MHDDSFDSDLPDDLRSIADALSQAREVADGHLLERVLRRVTAAPGARRRHRFLSVRTVATMALAAMCVLGVRLSGTSVSGAAAALVDTITASTSNTTSGSAAGTVYCGSGSAIGLRGWAPSFRWHYGFPGGISTTGVAADDGWSASVQPTCPSGSLSIVFHDDSLSLAPGTTLYGGYDFHAANDPGFTLTTYAPTITFSPIACANGSTPTASSLTLAMSNGSYDSPANTPNWIPTGDKLDSAGFQGSFKIPDVCNGSNVIVSGGSFTTTIKVG